MTEFVLVSCSKSKQDGVHQARDLYEPSRIFRKRKRFGEERGDYWGVLSAKHGYLPPWQAVDDYERHISDRTPIWGAFVLDDLLRDLDYLDVDTVTILAGSGYVDPLVTELEAHGYDVVDYNRGLRPGERYSKLKEELQPGEQQTLVTDGGRSLDGDAVKQVDVEFDWRHGLMRCLLCDAQGEFIVGRNPTRAGEITTITCTDCGFETTHVCEQVFVPSEDLDTLGMDLDPMDPLPPTQPMQRRSFSSDTRGAMHPTIYHLRILVLLTIVLAATTLLVEVITV